MFKPAWRDSVTETILPTRCESIGGEGEKSEVRAHIMRWQQRTKKNSYPVQGDRASDEPLDPDQQ